MMNFFRHTRSGARGVSFPEILIALSILFVALLPSLNIFIGFKRYTLHSEDIDLALRLSQEKVDHYRTYSYADLRKMVDTGVKEPEPEEKVTRQTNLAGYDYADPRYDKYKRKTTITTLDSDPNKILIKVRVWWYEQSFAAGDPRFVECASLVCQDVIL